jgi:hypothetical protein
MLPSRGCCHAVFLLVFTSRLKSYAQLDDWVGATRGRATIMAATLNLPTVARALIALNLVTVEPVCLNSALKAVGDDGSLETFARIARILLERSPPPWLKIAVSRAGVNREYIPANDFESLAWLGDALDSILLDVYRSQENAENVVAKVIGDAAELLLVAGLKRMGGAVVHVAQISDAYGYDIECHLGGRTLFIEVKACSASTSDRFILTRNEFEKSQALRSEWRLVQVVFRVGAVFGPSLGPEDIVEVRELLPDILLRLCSADSDTFRWIESAEVRPRLEQWTARHFEFDPDFRVPLNSSRGVKQSF